MGILAQLSVAIRSWKQALDAWLGIVEDALACRSNNCLDLQQNTDLKRPGISAEHRREQAMAKVLMHAQSHSISWCLPERCRQ